MIFVRKKPDGSVKSLNCHGLFIMVVVGSETKKKIGNDIIYNIKQQGNCWLNLVN
jgi:hypothetical protein